MKRDGSEFPIELTITRIGEADPPMFTGFMRDITARKAYEEERERLLELERVARLDADQSRGQLAAILSGVADAVTAQAPDGTAAVRERLGGRDPRLRLRGGAAGGARRRARQAVRAARRGRASRSRPSACRAGSRSRRAAARRT